MKKLLLLIFISVTSLSCTEKKIKMQAYMSPSCGCCKKWVTHLEENGFEVESIFRENMRSINNKIINEKHIKSVLLGLDGSTVKSMLFLPNIACLLYFL